MSCIGYRCFFNDNQCMTFFLERIYAVIILSCAVAALVRDP